MSAETAGIVGIAVLLLFFFLRMPVAFAMTTVGLIGFTYVRGPEPALIILVQDIYESLSSYSLSVIPMFILMGGLAFEAGISMRLYNATYTWFGQFRGGLTIATVIACAGFAAICGSTAATAATVGTIAIPEMRKYKYDLSLATGTVAAAGTLGVLIPPSTVLIVYGILIEESIGKLFIAGILPGLVLAVLFVAVVFVRCLLNPSLGPACNPTTWKEKTKALSGVAEAGALFLFSIGGLFFGLFSATQAGAVGAGGALIIGLIRGQVTLTGIFNAGRESLRTACMVLFIILGAIVFGHFMAVTGIPSLLVEWVKSLPLSPTAIILVIMFIFFVGGFFMDSMALIVLLIPIFFPLISKLGFDPIWFGVIVVLLGEMGVITPPVGINVFVIKGIARDVPLQEIFRGIFPFLGALILMTIIMLVFPKLATFLPSFVRY